MIISVISSITMRNLLVVLILYCMLIENETEAYTTKPYPHFVGNRPISVAYKNKLNFVNVDSLARRPIYKRVIPANALSIIDPSMSEAIFQGFAVNAGLGTLLSFIKQNSLTKEGLLHAGLLGFGLWTFLGFKV